MERQASLASSLQQAQAGDVAAADAFMKAAGTVQRRFLGRWMDGLADRQGILDDAVQDALLQVWIRYRSCNAGTDAGIIAWLMAIARTATIDALRRWKPEYRAQVSICELSDTQQGAEEDDGSPVPFDVAPLFAHLKRTYGDEALELLWRRLVRGESWEEVGRELGISWTAARRRYQRIISASRQYVMSYLVTGGGVSPSARYWMARVLASNVEQSVSPMTPDAD